MVALSAGAPANVRDSVALEDVRGQALRQVVTVSCLLGWAMTFVTVRSDWLVSWLPALVLLFSALIAYWLVASHYHLSAWVMIIGVELTLYLVARFYPGSAIPYVLPTVIFLAGVLLDPPAIALVTGYSGVFLLVILPGLSGDHRLNGLASPLFLSIGAGILAWLSTRPLYVALHSAWDSYAQAVQVSEGLRDRQGELNRQLADLEAACERLEGANQELERARAAAAEARRLKSEFAATISHELRTPLNLIIGFSEVMVMAPESYGDRPLPPGYRGDVEAIHRNARHLSSLIDDILDLSQLDAHRLALQKEATQLASVVEEAADAVRALFEDKGLSFRIEAAADLPVLQIDRTRIRQVVINLLNNAVRFTERGGICVTLAQGTNEIEVCVADTGIGIEPRDLSAIFDEFRQADSTTRRRYGGSGLGLAICKRFVELHGGSIWAESTPQQGSRFYFTLPVADQIAAAGPRSDWETWVRLPLADDRRILVICDEPKVGHLFERHLAGYQIRIVPNLAEGQRLVKREAIAAVVQVVTTEHRWPTSIVQTRQAFPAVPVAICSFQELAPARVFPGAVAHLVKPVLREELLETLNAVRPDARDVLVVDDDPEMVRLLRLMLRSASRRYRVRQALDGAASLAAMRQRRPDIVLLDILMPGMDGRAVLEQLRADATLHGTKVVVITAMEGEIEAIAAVGFAVTREPALSLAELMAGLQTSFDGLRSSPGPGNVRSLPGSPVGSPA
jgi:signal transduction histidine kinase/CheY-like chemotaxis protein